MWERLSGDHCRQAQAPRGAMSAPALQRLVGTAVALDQQASVGRYAVDTFAAVLRVEAQSTRQDTQPAPSYAMNVWATRRDPRKAAAAGKRVITAILPKAERAVRQVARLNCAQV